MSRIKQPAGIKGSLKYIQNLINNYPEIVNSCISNNFKDFANEKIEWLSPIKNDDYAEYRDSSFIKLLGLNTNEIQLEKFWPKGGPQWDALAKTESGKVILVEAKANISEISSSGTKAKKPQSIELIQKSLTEVKQFLEIINDIDWSKKYYQYTNRIAHLYYLRKVCKKEVYLINIYFVNDKYHISTAKHEFELAIEKLKMRFGIETHQLDSFMCEIFIDVNELETKVALAEISTGNQSTNTTSK